MACMVPGLSPGWYSKMAQRMYNKVTYVLPGIKLRLTSCQARDLPTVLWLVLPFSLLLLSFSLLLYPLLPSPSLLPSQYLRVRHGPRWMLEGFDSLCIKFFLFKHCAVDPELKVSHISSVVLRVPCGFRDQAQPLCLNSCLGHLPDLKSSCGYILNRHKASFL